MESKLGRLRKVSADANHTGPLELGDFITTKRVVFISIIATAIGILSAFVALALLRLIGLFTNLFFFHRWSTTLASPVGNTLGGFEIVVPVIGALIVAATQS